MAKRQAVKEPEVEEQSSVEELDLSTETKANLTAISQGYKWMNGSGGVETLPAPTVTSLVPNTKVNNSAAFTLVVNGTNFISGTAIQFGSTVLATTYISPTGVSAQITPAMIPSAQTIQVKVLNGTLASGTSPFTVT